MDLSVWHRWQLLSTTEYKIQNKWYNSQFWNSFLLLRVYISNVDILSQNCERVLTCNIRIASKKKSELWTKQKWLLSIFIKINDVAHINFFRSLSTIQNCKIRNKIKGVVFFSGDSKPVLIIIITTTTIYLTWQETLVNELYKLKC